MITTCGIPVAEDKLHVQRIGLVGDLTVVVGVTASPLVAPISEQPEWRKHNVDSKALNDSPGRV